MDREQVVDLFATIERTAVALGTDVNSSTLLLIQYLWNEERLVADRQDCERFLGATRPLVPSLEFNDGPGPLAFCNHCMIDSPLVTTDCNHQLCQSCLSRYVRQMLAQGETMPLCPQCDEFFLNPSFIQARVDDQTLSSYLNVLAADKRRNTTTTPLMTKVGNFLWRHKYSLAAATLLAAISLKKAWDLKNTISDWMKNHPGPTKFLTNAKELYDDGKDIMEPENILKLIKMSKQDLYNFAIKAFKSKAKDLVIGGEDLTTQNYSDFVFHST